MPMALASADVEILSALGRGGHASVYLGRRKSSQQLVAIKCIEEPTDRSSSAHARHVETEQRVLALVTHPCLARSLRVHRERASIYIEMEYIAEARPLYQCIWGYRHTGYLPEELARSFCAQIVIAVQEMHALGYLHRDLKTGNVLIGRDGIARVIDFGLAKEMPRQHQQEQEQEHPDHAADQENQRTWTICGTHYIMAPEVFRGGPYGFEADWWSCGVMLFEMLFGHPPWAYNVPHEAGSGLARYFQTISASCSPLVIPDAPAISDDARSLLQQLLTLAPCDRLGHRGADEIMAHPWFQGTDWTLLRDLAMRRDELHVPYDPETDFNPLLLAAHTISAPARSPSSSSSAASIDPYDDAQFFGDF